MHDLSDGGLAVALAEMAMHGDTGATVKAQGDERGFFFGEDQGRYVLTATSAQAAAIQADAKLAGVPLARIGVTGGAALTLGVAPPMPLAALREANENWFPDFMDGKSEAA